jgi:site-specific recombinase XerD
VFATVPEPCHARFCAKYAVAEEGDFVTRAVKKQKNTLSNDEIVRLYLDEKKAAGRSERTLLDIKKTLSHFISKRADWLGNPRAVLEYLVGGGYNNSTFNLRRAYLKGFYQWALLEGWLEGPLEGWKDPFAKIHHRKPVGRCPMVDPEDMLRLLDTISSAEDNWMTRRDGALVLLQYDTGIRPSEALGVTPQDVRLRAMDLLVRAEVSKTHCDRTLPFSDRTANAIERLLAIRPAAWPDSSTLYANQDGGRLSPITWAHRLKEWCKRAHIKPVTPYELRHAAALAFLRAGGDAFSLQAMLGHTSMGMTQRYVHLAATDLREVHHRASPANALYGEKRKRAPRKIREARG